jgi:RNA polymerase sigma factor (sigma-70 family)
MSPSDTDLIRQYAQQGSQAAFSALVNRHLNLVYSAARRQVRSPQLAEEVAQSVFCDLARNAGSFKPGTTLTGWLYLVTRRTAIDTIRKESRRQSREQAAGTISAMNAKPDDWLRVEPLLDEAMETLHEDDRSVLLLRFFEDKSLREVGETLGTSENAAQKRVSRALDQLRAAFLRRGIALTAAGLATDLSAHAISIAPAALGAAISSSAAVTVTTLGHVAAATTRTIAMTTTQKVLIASVVAAAVVAVVYQAVTLHRQDVQIAQLQNLSATWQREIQRLDRERSVAASRLAQTTAIQPGANASDDPAFDARMRALVETVNRLKKYLDQHPAEQIPEIHSLSDQAWFALAQRYSNLGTDDADYRPALASLRNSAKSEFLHAAERALTKYLKGSQGILPSEVAQLAGFFDPPVENDIFQRYEMTAGGPATALSKSAMIFREKASLAIDPARDNQAGLIGYGVSMGAFPNAAAQSPAVFDTAAQQKTVDQALRAFADAHGGNDPAIDEVEALLPYFQNPDDGARIVQRMRDVQAQMMPPALNQAWNEARRAYAITHHGAEATDQLELASYFQSPMDGARYLDYISRRAGLK